MVLSAVARGRLGYLTGFAKCEALVKRSESQTGYYIDSNIIL